MELSSIYESVGVSEETYLKSIEIEESIVDLFADLDMTGEFNHIKVLKALQDNRLSDSHFGWHTGYGYDDPGREVVEKIYAQVFGAEDAIVRPQIVNGTHALTLCLWGILRPGDEMICVTGSPYDTLHSVIGIEGSNEDRSSLYDYGIAYRGIDLAESGDFDYEAIGKAISDRSRMVYLQRSAGYSWRKSLQISNIGKLISFVKAIRSDIIVMVDNCYGEFLERREPCDVGADIIAGSLIKNPGGGLALTGGYVAGRADLVSAVANRMTSPKIGKECGLTFGQNRSILHGLFIAPQVVSGAIKGAAFCAKLFEDAGYEVCPGPRDKRSDIIQAVKLCDPDKIVAFCGAIQSSAPVDSYVTPVPWAMPGYDSEVIMAAGAFVQGSSIELSADAPIREPYIVYFQGGLTYYHSKIGAMKAYEKVMEAGGK